MRPSSGSLRKAPPAAPAGPGRYKICIPGTRAPYLPCSHIAHRPRPCYTLLIAVSRPACLLASSVSRSSRTLPPSLVVSGSTSHQLGIGLNCLSPGHVFCYSCIVKIVRSITPYTTHHFCPTCRHPYTVGKPLPYPEYKESRHSLRPVPQHTLILTWSRTIFNHMSRPQSAGCISSTAHRAH